MAFVFTHDDTEYVGMLEARHKYNNNGNTAVELYARPRHSGEPFDQYRTLSVNTDRKLAANEFVFKTYSENAGLYEECLRLGLIEPTGRAVGCGFAGPQPVVTLTPNWAVIQGVSAAGVATP